MDRVRQVLGTSVGWFACATLTLQLTRFDGGVAIVWLAGAFLFAKLASVPHRQWRWLTLASLPSAILASALFGIGGIASVPIGCICVGEAIAAAWLMRRYCPRYGGFASVVEVGRFLLVCGLAIPAVSATLAAACVHAVIGSPYQAAWRDWFLGHGLGLIAFGPPLLLAFRGDFGRWRRSGGQRQIGEAALLLLAVAVAAGAAFGQSAVPLVVVPVVPMMAATFRLGRFGAVASILILVAIAMPCSLAGLGPTALLTGSMSLKFQVLQIYFATTVTILLPVAAELKARRRLTERLRAAEELHRLVLDRTGDVILRCDREGRIRYVSPLVVREWGFRPDEIVGRTIFELLRDEDRPALAEAREQALSNPDVTAAVEYRISRGDGGVVWVESHIRANVDAHGSVTGTVSIIREVTERRLLVEDLARRATADPLTGLLNRRGFDDALAARAKAGDADACIALFDLDHFKRINDSHGHAAGDLVLKHFAELLDASVRDGDKVARLGGEEFAVLLNGASITQAQAVCERVRVRLADGEYHLPSGTVVRATVSAGIAPFSVNTEAAVVLAVADAALYRAKEAGRNRLALAA